MRLPSITWEDLSGIQTLHERILAPPSEELSPKATVWPHKKGAASCGVLFERSDGSLLWILRAHPDFPRLLNDLCGGELEPEPEGKTQSCSLYPYEREELQRQAASAGISANQQLSRAVAGLAAATMAGELDVQGPKQRTSFWLSGDVPFEAACARLGVKPSAFIQMAIWRR